MSPFTVKDWRDYPDTTTPISATALEDLETRLATYATNRAPIFNVKDYGALGDGATDDTTAIQAALTAAYNGGGGIVLLPPGNYVASTLTYRTDSGATPKGLRIVGSPGYATKVSQKAGTADLLLKCGDLTTAHQFLSIEDIAFNGFASQATSTGLITLEGTSDSVIRRCAFSYFKNQAIQIKGGITDGDAMYNTVEGCMFQQPLTSSIFIRLTCAGSGAGSHPDGTNILNNHLLGLGAGTAGTGIKVEKPTVNPKLGPDACFVGWNRMTEIATPINLEGGQSAKVIGNRLEVVVAPTTMTILVQNSAAWTSVLGTVFIGNEYATGGVAANLTFTDTSSDGAARIAEVVSQFITSTLPGGLTLTDTTGTAAKGLTLSDAHFFRVDANVVALDKALRADTWVRSNQGATSQVTVGLSSAGASSPEIVFGSSNDVNLKRVATASTPTLGTDNPFSLKSYTTAGKPAAGNVPAGTVIYVSDGGAGAVFQGSNGSAWVNLG